MNSTTFLALLVEPDMAEAVVAVVVEPDVAEVVVSMAKTRRSSWRRRWSPWPQLGHVHMAILISYLSFFKGNELS